MNKMNKLQMLNEKLGIKIRNITVEDYPELVKWWKQYEGKGLKIPKSSMLPKNGLGGFVVEKNGSLIASAFLYFTNSTMGYIDYLIADPKYREDDRQDVLVQLAAHATGVAVKSGCEQVWAMTTNKKLIQMVTGKSMPMEVLPDTYKVLYVYDKRTSRLND